MKGIICVNAFGVPKESVFQAERLKSEFLSLGTETDIVSIDHDHVLTAVSGDLSLKGPDENWNITLPDSMSCLVPAGYPYKIFNKGGRCLVTPFADVSGEYNE